VTCRACLRFRESEDWPSWQSSHFPEALVHVETGMRFRLGWTKRRVQAPHAARSVSDNSYWIRTNHKGSHLAIRKFLYELYTLQVPQLVWDVQISPTTCKMGYPSPTTCLLVQNWSKVIQKWTRGQVFFTEMPIYIFQ
jgi:hypothetical protein